MKFCTKMENGCRTCTRSQFWMGDDERRQFLTQQWGACWKEREETDQERGGLHRLQETSWKGVQGVRVWFEKQGVPFQTGSWSKRGSQWGPWDARNDTFLWMRPNRNFWSCCDTPLHHNILVLCCRHSIPQVHIYLVQKTRTLSRRHLEQMQIKHCVQCCTARSSSSAVCSDRPQGCASPACRLHHLVLSSGRSPAVSRWTLSYRPEYVLVPLNLFFFNQNSEVAKHLQVEQFCS